MIHTEEMRKFLPFTAHRIQISNSTWTIPEGGDDPFSALTTKVVCERAGGSLAGKRILDLGCLEGGYSVAFAKMGAEQVVGVEVRELSHERCLLLKRCLNVEKVDFVRDDVRNVTRDLMGDFDIVFAQGLLYHLDDPFTFLRNVAELTRDFALIDTHVAGEKYWAHGCSKQLSERVFGSKTYRGREAAEYPEGLMKQEIEKLFWASYGNTMAFWLTEESLVQMLLDVGFKYISKVYVPRGYRCQEGCKEECRVVLVAKKSWNFGAPVPA